MLVASGGWPALAELTATAGVDLVLEYLWAEVLEGIGGERARLLAAFEVCGGGDDEIASALADRAMTVRELVADVPLAASNADGSGALHPLWRPALRRCLSEGDVSVARHRAAGVHRAAGRCGQAIELLADAEAWDDVVDVLRDAETATAQHVLPPLALAAWVNRLPRAWQTRPEARLALGCHVRARTPLDALPLFADAAQGFRARGDVEGELAAILQDGAVRWAANDMAGMLGLYGRVLELAEQGWRGAIELAAIGSASMAHMAADSGTVLAVLDGVGSAVTPEWRPTIHWLRSVAHRRDGDLQHAYDELGDADLLVGVDAHMAQQLTLARLRTDWLAGHVDEVRAGLPAICEHYVASGNRFLATEASLELAAKAGHLGELDTARDLLARADPVLPDVPGQLARVLHGIAAAAVAVGDGDEDHAADVLRELVSATLGQPEGWYWRDRAAIALTSVLLPESRERWAHEPLARVHAHGLVLAEAVVAARTGDLDVVRRLEWPPTGIVRAHLPLRWIVELAAVARDVGAPAPSELAAALGGARLHASLRAIASDGGDVAAAAGAWLHEVPSVPDHRLRIEVLGHLRVLRDGLADAHPDLKRQRVRQLLSYLIVHQRCRRERVAEDLWPDAADAGQNLRVTLTHLQRALQPERGRGDPPYFLTTDGPWLALVGDDRLEIDAWQLDDLLDRAAAAEAADNPGLALGLYREALPIWRGEPFADAPYDDWAIAPRTGLQARYSAGAIRAGELLLAAGAPADAIAAGEHAITADPTVESAYGLVARGHVAIDDDDGARRTIDRCRAAIASVGRTPTARTASYALRST